MVEGVRPSGCRCKRGCWFPCKDRAVNSPMCDECGCGRNYACPSCAKMIRRGERCPYCKWEDKSIWR